MERYSIANKTGVSILKIVARSSTELQKTWLASLSLYLEFFFLSFGLRPNSPMFTHFILCFMWLIVDVR